MTYPWADLEPLLNATFGRTPWQRGDRGAEYGYGYFGFESFGWTDEDAALARGVSRQTISRWKRYGLGLMSADHVAVRLGRMPGEIWPAWDADSLEWADARCARRDVAAAKKRRDNAARKAARKVAA